MNVHPYAAAFPMMSDDELDALADDIKANGLRHPIVVDADGMLIDGRNRLAACELAGVEPTFEALPPGTDPVALIESENERRRHMTIGQRAMMRAKYLADQGARVDGRWTRNTVLAPTTSTPKSTWPHFMAQAGVIVDAAAAYPDEFGDLASAVIAGRVPFAEAVDQARNARAAAELADLERHKPLTDWFADVYAIETDLEKLAANPPRLNARPTRQHQIKYVDTAKAIRAHLRAITTFIESEAETDV